jgi:dihydroorotate dehydrogenase
VREVKAVTRIPVIASVTECSLDTEFWLRDCTEAETAGASAIQLDLFYMENLFALDGFAVQLISLLKELICHCHVPIMPKLNISLPAEYAIPLFRKAGIRYVSLLDSIRSPAPLHFDEKGSPYRDQAMLGPGLSVFGSFMFPLTRFYTDTLCRAGFEVCAGGGIQTATDILDLLLLGATTVQIATEVLFHGCRRFGELEGELNKMLAHIGIGDAAMLRKMGRDISRPADPYALYGGIGGINPIRKNTWHLTIRKNVPTAVPVPVRAFATVSDGLKMYYPLMNAKAADFASPSALAGRSGLLYKGNVIYFSDSRISIGGNSILSVGIFTQKKT